MVVTGVCGQLGHDVVNAAAAREYETIGSDIGENYSGVADGSAVTTAPYVQLDITDKDAVQKVVKRFGENLVFFRTGDGELGCVTDLCAHRGASLAGGCVQDGNISALFTG